MNKIVSSSVLFLLVTFSQFSLSLEEGLSSEVEAIYLGTDTGSYPYVTLKDSGSMPGCHAERGGYLHGTDINRAYSSVLAALRAGSKVRAYYQLNSGNEGWGKCFIKAFSLY